MKKFYLPTKLLKLSLFLFLLNLILNSKSLAQTQQVFTTSGGGTFTMPAGVTQVTVECWGGGGNGGSTGTNGNKTGGGGGGAYARKLLTVIPSTIYNYNVGVSGGGDSWFSTTGTVLAKGGASGNSTTSGALGGSALTSIGDQVYGGGNGGNAGGSNTGGGGSSAGNSANGNNATGATPGAAPGGGGAGAIGLTGSANGNTGNNPGGGGSGGWKQGAGSGGAGAGAVGKVVISYYLLTGTSVPASVCQNTTASVTLTGTAGNLPVGTYTVTYNLTGANTATNATATMTVSAAGTGTFTTGSLPNNGSTTVTVTKLASGFYSSSVGSNNAFTFTVGAPAQPTVTNGGPTTFCAGGSVVLTSSAGSTYKWYSDGVLIPAATSQTYTATASAVYTVVVTNASGCTSVPSADMVVTVNSLPATPSITAGGPTTFCADGNLTLSSTSAAGYQWYKGGVLIPGETNQDYSPTTSGVYTVVVSNANGCFSSPSSGISVTVNPLPPPPGITPGSGTTFCSGLSVTLTSDLATSYQWYELSGIIPAATNRNYSANATGSYYVKVTNSFGCVATSSVENVTVNPLPDITIATQATSVCASASTQITQLTFTNIDNSPTTYSITWNAAALGAGFVNVLDDALPVLPAPISVSVPGNAPANTYTGTLTVKNLNGCQSTSKNFTVTVATTPNVSNFSISAANGCLGTGSVITVNSTSLGNGIYNVKYDLSGSNVATNNTAVMTFSGNTGTFTATALNAGATTITVTEIALIGCSSTVNNTANFTINDLPAVPTISGDNEVCVDASITLTSSSGGGSWSSAEPSIASVDNAAIVTGLIGGISTIKYTTALDANGCSNFNTHDITVNALPAVEPITGQTSYCVATSATLSNATPNGTWSSSNNTVATVDNSGLVDALIVGNTIITYTTQVNAAGCFNFTTANVVVNPDPTVVAGNDTTVCESSSPGSITLSGASYSGGAGSAFWTIENGGNGTLGAQGSGNNPGNVKYTPAANFYGTITLKLTTNAVGTCGTASATRLINITQKPTVTPGNPITVCESSSPSEITLSTAAVGGSANTGTWSIVAPGGGILSDINPVNDPANVTYTPAANVSGTVTLRLTTDAIGVCGTTSADRVINLTANPTAIGGNQNSVCQSTTPGSVSLIGASIGGGANTGVWTISLGSGTLSNINPVGNPATVSFTPAANFTGTVKLTLTTDAPGGCTATSAERIIDVTPASTVIAGGPDVVCQSATPGTITLNGASVGGGATTGTWTVAAGTLSSTNPEINPGIVIYTPDVNYTGTVSLLLTTNATGNCPAVNATRTITVNPNATIALTSAAATTTQSPCVNTAITSITYSVGGGGSGASVTGLPTGVSGLYNSGTKVFTISGTPTVPGPFSYTVTATSGTCASADITGTITVNALSVGGTVTGNQIICQNAVPAGDLTLTGNTGTVVRWQKSTSPTFASFTNIPVTMATLTGADIGALSTSTYFRAEVQSGPCGSVFSGVALIAVNAPFTPTITPSPNDSICLGQSVTLTAGDFSTADTIVGGNFTDPKPLGWTGHNGDASNNNNSGNLPWGVSNNNTLGSPLVTYSSASPKYMIVSGNVNSVLTTPSFSTVGRTSLALEWYQGYQFTGGGSGTVQISIDGGVNYTTLATYNSSSPAVITNSFTSNPKSSINLNYYLGQPDVRIKFVYSGAGSTSNWALEDVNVVGPYQPINYTWSINGSDVPGQSVTVTPVLAGDTTFALVAATGGCIATSNSILVHVNPVTVGGTISPSPVSVCTSGSSTLTLTGRVGSITRWEKSIDGGASWTNIVNTTPSNIVTVVAQTTLYRALVQSGTCPSAYSTVTLAGLHNVWTGRFDTDWQKPANWSDSLLPSTSCPTVLIPSVTNKPILSNGTSTIINLDIQSSSLTINGTGLLQLAGTISNTGTFNVANGSLEFNGASAQSIAGSLFVGNDIKNLTVSNTTATGLSLTGGVPLNILGDLSFGASNATLTTNDNLVLRSTATSTARVADITSNGTITNAYTSNKFAGKVTVERFYPGNRRWRLVTSPLSGAGPIFNSWQNTGVYTSGKGMFVTGLNPTLAAGNGLDTSYQNNYSMKGWNSDTGYVNVTNTKTYLLSTSGATSAANIGYFTFVRGDRSRSPDNTIIPNANNTTLSSKGNLQTGPQTFAAAGLQDQFTLIGNPYASPVDFNKISLSNVPKRFITWDPLLNDVGGFVVLDDIDNNNVYAPYTSPGGQDNNLQSSQAFFVQTQADGAASVTFNESDKTAINKLGLFRPLTEALHKDIQVTLYKFKPDNTAYVADGTYAEFDDQYKPDVTFEDALKFTNINETFGLVRNSKMLAIERRPTIKITDTLFLKLSRTTRRNYRMEFKAGNLDQDNLAGFVEDKYLNQLTPMNLNGNTTVDFAITADAPSAAADRFKVIFKPSVIYTDIKANMLNSDIAVEWNVPGEYNIKEYEIERSTDGVHFTTAGTQAASGNSNSPVQYQWLDVSPATGEYYYRIRSVSLNNVTGYSGVAKVIMNKPTPSMYVFPNPVIGNAIQLQMNSLPQGMYAVRLMNSLGQAVVNKQISHGPGTATETIRPGRKLIPGIYHLEIVSPDKKITMIKVNVQ